MKILNVQPQYVPSAAANLLNPDVASLSGPVGFTMTQPFLVINHVRITNKDTAARTVTFYKGASGGSAGGTEVFWANYMIAAQDVRDWYGQMRVDAADFITGICDAASKVTIEFDCEIGVS